MSKVLDAAAHLQRRAGQLVESTGIRRLWETVGKTVLVGSARFGLMTTANIDFEVYVQRPDPRDGFSVMRELSALPGVTQIRYANLMDSDDPGLYWRVDYTDRAGVVWDIDNWLVPFTHPFAGMAEAFASAMQSALTPATRLAILELKAALGRCDGEPRPRGIDIYKAVLQGRVQSLKDFREWQSRNPPPIMETWRP